MGGDRWRSEIRKMRDICLNTEETNQHMPTALHIDIHCSGRSDGPEELY